MLDRAARAVAESLVGSGVFRKRSPVDAWVLGPSYLAAKAALAAAGIQKWRPISEFNPAVHKGAYLFTDGSNVVLGHWNLGFLLAYSGQDMPIEPTHWQLRPEPPVS